MLNGLHCRMPTENIPEPLGLCGRRYRRIAPALPGMLLMALAACQTPPHSRLVYPDGVRSFSDWSVEELDRDIAVKQLHRNDATSTHLIRLNGSETPHYHDRHELSVTLLTGTAVMHFRGHDIPLRAGDTVFIPRGVYHWAENAGVEASIVHAVFSPGFDGRDRRSAE